MDSTARRADGSIVLLDEVLNEVMRWNIIQCWPCKYTGPVLNANSNEFAIEELEISHEGLSVVSES